MGSSSRNPKTVHLKVVSFHELSGSSLPGLAFEPGAITFCEGADGFEALVFFLASHRGYRVMWANREFEIALSSLHASGIDLTKLVFTTAHRPSVAISKALAEEQFPVIIANKRDLSHEQLEVLRPQLQAASATLFLIDVNAMPSPPAFRLSHSRRNH